MAPTDKSRIDTVRRMAAFLRHIPPGKIGRRVALKVQRKLAQHNQAWAFPDPGSLDVTGNAIQPVMPPRPCALVRDGTNLEFTFLGKTRVLARPLPWRQQNTDRSSQLWRMNLHYMEYLEACDDAAFVDVVEDWLDADLPFNTDTWQDVWNSYAVSLRTVIWLQQLARRADLPKELRARMHKSIANQTAFLERNLETDIGGNHLIKNMKALVLASCAYRGPAADRWRKRGLQLLHDALDEQVSSDGLHYERSPSYHAQVFVDFLECRIALGNDPFDGRLDAALDAMAQGIADLAHPDGRPALFNDAGLSMSYAPVECLDAYEAFAGKRPIQQTVFSYAESGYFGLSDADNVFIADCGLIAPDSLPGHGHGDVLSFEWSVSGQRVIVDQGVHEYVAGEKRAMSRSAANHNTISLEGIDQAEFFGDFRVGRRPKVQLLDWDQRVDGFRLMGSHDGFQQMANGPIHTRTFDVTRRSATIEDKLSASSKRQVRGGFLLHPDVSVTISDQHADLVVGNVQIHIEASVPIEVEPAVWWPDMGKEIATKRLVALWPEKCTNAKCVLTVLSGDAHTSSG